MLLIIYQHQKQLGLKPHPKIFEDMIDQLGVLPEQIMMLAMMR